jgi:hypothetical protein
MWPKQAKRSYLLREEAMDVEFSFAVKCGEGQWREVESVGAQSAKARDPDMQGISEE